MGWLHKVLHGEGESEPESIPVVPNPEHLVPPALPKLGMQDPAAAHKRTYASKVCPSCEAKVKELPHETVACENCGQPIVVKTGEDGRWHLLREADLRDFEAQQEQIRNERSTADEEALLEAGFLSGDVQVDVDHESDHQDELKRLAGERSRAGSIEPVVALLTREPGHANDKNAIRVDVGNATVGYIQKLSAKEIQPLMQRLEKAGRPAWVRGWVVGGWEDDRSDNNYRIRLDSLPKVK
jgi:hypothetical protein